MNDEPEPDWVARIKARTDAGRAAAERYAELARAREELIHRERPTPRPLTPARSEALRRGLAGFEYHASDGMAAVLHYEESAGLQ